MSPREASRGKPLKPTTMKKLILSFLTALILISCTKYPDGPGISLQSKAKRIEGDYTVKQFTANGADILSYYSPGQIWTNCSYYVDYTDSYVSNVYAWHFSKNGGITTSQTSTTTQVNFAQSSASCFPIYDITTDTYSDAGTWKLVEDKECMLITLNAAQAPITAEIIELRDKQIKLKWIDVSLGVTYELTLVE